MSHNWGGKNNTAKPPRFILRVKYWILLSFGGCVDQVQFPVCDLPSLCPLWWLQKENRSGWGTVWFARITHFTLNGDSKVVQSKEMRGKESYGIMNWQLFVVSMFTIMHHLTPGELLSCSPTSRRSPAHPPNPTPPHPDSPATSRLSRWLQLLKLCSSCESECSDNSRRFCKHPGTAVDCGRGNYLGCVCTSDPAAVDHQRMKTKQS